jgi:hypothetical protein
MVNLTSSGIRGGVWDFVIESEEDGEGGMCKDSMSELRKKAILTKGILPLSQSDLMLITLTEKLESCAPTLKASLSITETRVENVDNTDSSVSGGRKSSLDAGGVTLSK